MSASREPILPAPVPSFSSAYIICFGKKRPWYGDETPGVYHFMPSYDDAMNFMAGMIVHSQDDPIQQQVINEYHELRQRYASCEEKMRWIALQDFASRYDHQLFWSGSLDVLARCHGDWERAERQRYRKLVGGRVAKCKGDRAITRAEMNDFLEYLLNLV